LVYAAAKDRLHLWTGRFDVRAAGAFEAAAPVPVSGGQTTGVVAPSKIASPVGSGLLGEPGAAAAILRQFEASSRPNVATGVRSDGPPPSPIRVELVHL